MSGPESPASREAQKSAQESEKKPKDVAEKFLGPKDSMASSPHTFQNALKAAKDFILAHDKENVVIDVDTKTHPEAARWKLEAARLKAELQDPAIADLFLSKAGTEVGPINAFLKDKGFSIQLQNQGEGLYIASAFKQKVEWKNEGEKTQLDWMDDPKNPVEAAKLGKDGVKKYTVDTKPVYELSTKDNSRVYMMPADNMTTTPIDLYKKIRDIHEKRGAGSPLSDSLTFPKVDLQEKGDIEWLKGAQVGSYRVDQAKYENILTMDEKGAEAKAAASIAMSRGFSRPDMIEGPFLVWFVKPGEDGKDIITFAARVGEESLKKVEKK